MYAIAKNSLDSTYSGLLAPKPDVVGFRTSPESAAPPDCNSGVLHTSRTWTTASLNIKEYCSLEFLRRNLAIVHYAPKNPILVIQGPTPYKY